MIFASDGQEIRRRAGFVRGWAIVPKQQPDADAIGSTEIEHAEEPCEVCKAPSAEC